jgi:hypothetical protein
MIGGMGQWLRNGSLYLLGRLIHEFRQLVKPQNHGCPPGGIQSAAGQLLDDPRYDAQPLGGVQLPHGFRQAGCLWRQTALLYRISHLHQVGSIRGLYIELNYITLHYITLHYITLHYITLHYITLHYITSNQIKSNYIKLT